MKVLLAVIVIVVWLGSGYCLWDEEPEEEYGEDEWQPAGLRDTEFLQDQQHIESHYKEMKFLFEEGDVQAEEMEFHFFKAHDTNSDDHLDGLELFDALKHGSQRHLNRALAKHLTLAEQKSRTEQVYERLCKKIDKILEEDDKNDDGYISYFEYVTARRASTTLHQAEEKSDAE